MTVLDFIVVIAAVIVVVVIPFMFRVVGDDHPGTISDMSYFAITNIVYTILP